MRDNMSFVYRPVSYCLVLWGCSVSSRHPAQSNTVDCLVICCFDKFLIILCCNYFFFVIVRNHGISDGVASRRASLATIEQTAQPFSTVSCPANYLEYDYNVMCIVYQKLQIPMQLNEKQCGISATTYESAR